MGASDVGESEEPRYKVVPPSASSTSFKSVVAPSYITAEEFKLLQAESATKPLGSEAWQSSSTLLAGFAATFMSLVIGLTGVTSIMLYKWMILFLCLAVFLFLLATEFFAYVSSVAGKISVSAFIWFDLAGLCYNIGIASFAAGIIILFYIYGLSVAIYTALGFILIEIFLMIYFLMRGLRAKKRAELVEMRMIHNVSMSIYSLGLISMISILYYTMIIIGFI